MLYYSIELYILSYFPNEIILYFSYHLFIFKSQCILWTWENQENEEHNIIHVRPPQAKEVMLSNAWGLWKETVILPYFHRISLILREIRVSQVIRRSPLSLEMLKGCMNPLMASYNVNRVNRKIVKTFLYNSVQTWFRHRTGNWEFTLLLAAVR